MSKSCDFPNGGEVAIIGNNQYADDFGFTFVQAGSQVSVNFLGGDMYEVEMKLFWNGAFDGNTYGLVCKTNPISMVGMGDCPSMTISGSWDSCTEISGFDTFFQFCNSINASDLVGSYNLTIECQ